MIALKILATLIPLWLLVAMLSVMVEYLTGEIESWDDFWHTVIGALVLTVVVCGIFGIILAVFYLVALIWK